MAKDQDIRDLLNDPNFDINAAMDQFGHLLGDLEAGQAVDMLIDQIERQGAPVCVGIDPLLDRIPHEIWAKAKMSLEMSGEDMTAGDLAGAAVFEFSSAIIEPLIEAGIRVFKPQVAHFERHGSFGMIGYQGLLDSLFSLGMFVIADAKRGDIGSTSEAYAQGWLSGFDIPPIAHKVLGQEDDEMPGMGFSANMLTVNPYLGSDALEPLVRGAVDSGAGVFVLLKTSNPGSADLQDLELKSGGKLYHAVAKLIQKLGADSIGERGYSAVGAVVGATHPTIAKELRELLPETFFLVPGYGAQGATASDLLPCFDSSGGGAVVNSSRAVIHCYKPEDPNWKSKVKEAAEKLVHDVGQIAQQAAR